jgi:amidase
VRNPHDPARTTGGSSSGCAAIVASGECTMAIGGDQAGSIRLPAHFCGIVGLKPTWGLVPYTGIAPLEYTLDHAGPMTATVAENALLLQAIAGLDDDLDPRQYRPRTGGYTDALQHGVEGLRIGVLAEGFGSEAAEADVEAAVRAAASALGSLGARVEEVSIPEHRLGLAALVPVILQGNLALLRADGVPMNHRGLHHTGLAQALSAWHERADELHEGMKLELLMARHLERTARGRLYARAQNLARRLRAAYDAALERHDVLLMPTGPYKAPPIPGPDAPLAERLRPGLEVTVNTGPFNCTGHPALSVPCGTGDGLPIGMMLVGRWYDEATLFRAAHAYEQHAG